MHITGIVGGGQSARARPGTLPLGTLGIAGGKLSPPPHRQHYSVQKGEHVEDSLEPDNTVECSGCMTLECGCGERLVLLGLKEDWLAEQRMNFECECGQILTLTDRLDKDVVQEFRQIMRGAFRTPGS